MTTMTSASRAVMYWLMLYVFIGSSSYRCTSTGSAVGNDVREQEIDIDGIILVLAAGVLCISKASTSYYSTVEASVSLQTMKAVYTVT